MTDADKFLARYLGIADHAAREGGAPGVRGGFARHFWEAIKQAAAAEGETLPPGSFQAMNSLISGAVGRRNAASALQAGLGSFMRTGIPQAITADMIGLKQNPRSLAERNLIGLFDVRYPVEVLRAGERVTVWKTLGLTHQPPATLGHLLDLVQAHAGKYTVGEPDEFLGLAGAPEIEAF